MAIVSLFPVFRLMRLLILLPVGVGIEDPIGTHTMRKTFGFHAYRNGCSVELLQQIFNIQPLPLRLDISVSPKRISMRCIFL